jgi:hypothetical protein
VNHVASYRQEHTLRAAKPLVGKWEAILAEYGLADGQLFYQDSQSSLPDKTGKIKDEHWKDQLDRAGAEDHKESMGRVPVLHTRRDVPQWALCDANIAAYLKHKHPSVALCRGTADARSAVGNARDAAARTVTYIYLAYRAGWQDKDIADLVGVTSGAVEEQLCRIKADAELFFAKRATVKDVLVHNCHTVGDPQPKNCKCKMYVDHDEAREQVRQGLAEWMLVYPPKGKPYVSHGAVVAARATKTPRSAMIEKAQIMRNTGASGDAGHEQQASTEVFKEMLLAGLEALKVPFKADSRPGMPVLTFFADERSQ